MSVCARNSPTASRFLLNERKKMMSIEKLKLIITDSESSGEIKSTCLLCIDEAYRIGLIDGANRQIEIITKSQDLIMGNMFPRSQPVSAA